MIFLLVLIPKIITAGKSEIKFERISIEHGLSQSSISCIFQDSRGFMWFGTEDGLNKYDGYDFTVYKPDPENPYSLSNNYVRAIFEDSEGMLWIGTEGGGLNKFDHEREIFINYQSSPEDSNSLSLNFVRAICEDKEGYLWIGTNGGGLDKFDKSSDRFIHFRSNPDSPGSISSDYILSLLVDYQGVLWIGTQRGLNKYNPDDDSFIAYTADSSETNKLSHDLVWTIFEDRESNLWLGTDGGGLNRFDRERGLFYHYKACPENDDSLNCDNVRAIYQDRRGVLWIGTKGGGLNRFDQVNGVFHHYMNMADDPQSLSSNEVESIFEDLSGALWIGVYAGGINKYDREKANFTLYKNNPNDPNSLSNNLVYSILMDHSGDVWIGTHNGGLNRLESASGKFYHYLKEPDNPNSLCNNSVSAIYKDEEGIFWIGTQGGLCKFDKKRNRFKHFIADPDEEHSLKCNYIYSIIEDDEGNLWIGTLGGGVHRFDRRTEVFTQFKNDPNDETSLSSDKVLVVYEDGEGELWIGTYGGGLNRFQTDNNSFIRYLNNPKNSSSISNNNIMSIFEDSIGDLWIGTYGGGLNKFNREDETFTAYRVKNGLPGDVVYGILEDNKGCLWLSTNMGLSLFDPVNKSFRNYDVRDGLQSNEFNVGAFAEAPNGEMFFGGLNGLNSFYPDSLQDNPYIPPIVITDFKLFNESVPIAENSPLKKSITVTHDIKLTYKDYDFAFQFAALNYTIPEKNQYAYMMEGFDRDWNYIGTRRFAAYTILPAGRYIFRVKGSNNDGVWNEVGASIKLTITPPPWKTWYAYTFYVLVVLGLIYWYVRYKTKAQALEIERHRKELAQERMMTERLRQVDKLKDEFLANTSHELRTPLNGIIGIAESLYDSITGPVTDKIRANLSMVISSGRRLASLVNDILDFSKLKTANLELKLKPVNIKVLTDIVLKLNEPLVSGKKLKLINRISNSLSTVLADENRLQQIMHNLVGNAVKFTETGEIVISAVKEGDFLEISVSDTGIGIPKDKIDIIFKSFEQVDASIAREYGGAGLGLAITKQLIELHGGNIRVESAPGKGSTFTFTLPASEEEALYEETPSSLSKVKVTGKYDISVLEEIAEDTSERYKILVVDDEPINQQVLANHLAQDNYIVKQAMNGEEALSMIHEGNGFDLVLLDIMMPRMSGYEVCQRIREKYLPSELPVIMITAKDQVSDLVEGFTSGANDYIAKPFSKGELLARIKTHLNLMKINIAYSRFIPNEFLRTLGHDTILDVRLGDQVQGEMTILFSDIRSFTQISEGMSPKENFDFLNDYLKRVIPAIRDNNGFIDKYIGDAIMALFPNNPDDALKASIAVLQKLQEFNRTRLKQSLHEINIGIGLHTGLLMLGTIGDAKRMDGTVISDAVNLASRLEGLTKKFGSSIIISEVTLKGLENPLKYHYRYLGNVQVTGKKVPAAIYEVFEGDPQEVIELKMKTKEGFEEGLRLYFDMKFAEAAVYFNRVLNIDTGDKAAQTYLENSARYIVRGAPEGWHGVEEIEAK
ncbi:response regulator [bacterium]|nr:response regulator [bacterium]